MTVVMNQPTNSIILTMNSCKIVHFISLLLLRVSGGGGVHYLEGLGHDHRPGLPLCLGGVGSQDQGETGQEDEDRGQDGVVHHGWLAGWEITEALSISGPSLYTVELPEIEIIFRPHCSPPLFRRLNIRFIIITRKYKNVRNCSVFTF